MTTPTSAATSLTSPTSLHAIHTVSLGTAPAVAGQAQGAELSPLDKAINLIGTIDAKGGIADRGIRTRISNAIPRALFVAPHVAKDHYLSCLKEAERDLPPAALAAVVRNLEAINKSIPGSSSAATTTVTHTVLSITTNGANTRTASSENSVTLNATALPSNQAAPAVSADAINQPESSVSPVNPRKRFAKNDSGYVPGVSLNFINWTTAMVTTLVQDFNLFHNEALKIRVAAVLPGFDKDCNQNILLRHLVACLKKVDSSSPFKASDALLELQGIIDEAEQSTTSTTNTKTPVKTITNAAAGLGSGAQGYRNDVKLSDHANRALALILEIKNKEGLRDPSIRARIAEVIPMAKATSAAMAERHFTTRIKDADINLQAYRVEIIANKLDAINKSIPVPEKTDEKPARTFPRRSRAAKIEKTPAAVSAAVSQAQDIIRRICVDKAFLANDPLRTQVLELVPGSQNFNNTAIKRHLLKKLHEGFARLPEAEQSSRVARLAELETELQRKSAVFTTTHEGGSRNTKATGTIRRAYAREISPTLASPVTLSPQTLRAIDIVGRICNEKSFLAHDPLRAKVLELVPGSEDEHNRVIKRHLIKKLRENFGKQSEAQQEQAISALAAIEVELIKNSAALLMKTGKSSSSEEKDSGGPRRGTRLKIPKPESTARFSVKRFMPTAHSSLELEPETPFDLALGKRFLGPDVFNTLKHNCGSAPEFPAGLTVELLNSPCPFFPGHRIFETHILALIPAKLDEFSLSINSAIKILNPRICYSFDPAVKTLFCAKEAFAKESPAESYWVLIPRAATKHTDYDGYEKVTARELFIAAATFGLSTNHDIFGGMTGATSDTSKIDDNRIITVSSSDGELNVNSTEEYSIGNGVFSYIGWALKRKL